MSPEFSFVIPVRNGETTLGDLISSIQKQTLRNYEIIVVDNGSSDGTKSLCQGYSSIKYLYCENIGRSFARNFGAKHAEGKYLCFVDCDVALKADWLLMVEKYLKTHPVDGLATSIEPAFESERNLVDEYRRYFGQYKSQGSYLSLQKYRKVAPIINSACCVYLTKSFRVTGGYSEELVSNEDFELSIRMFNAGFLLGGTTSAKSKVRFAGKNRMWRYLVRTLVLESSSLVPEKTYNRFYLSQMLQLMSSWNIRLMLFASLVELMRVIGTSVAGISKKNKERAKRVRSKWIIKQNLKAFRYSFQLDEREMKLHKNINLVLIDDTFYSLSYDFMKFEKLSKDSSLFLLKIICGAVPENANKEFSDENFLVYEFSP